MHHYKLPKYLPKFNYIRTLHQCGNLKKSPNVQQNKKLREKKKTTKEWVVNVSKSES